MAPDNAVALGYIRPFDVRSGSQKDSWCACIGSLSEHDFVAFGKYTVREAGLFGTGHFVLVPRTAIEETENGENFIQFILASPTEIKLHAMAAARAASPNGRETINAAGMKMKAGISSAAVAV
jgi:hypothetical protein